MPIDTKVLEIISNETKNSIEDLPIVTPSIYASIFSEFASERQQIIENEENLARNLIKTECTNLTNIQTKTSQNVNTLSKNTSRAIDAIKDKDDSLLNTILKETEILRLEVEKLKNSVYKDELTHIYNRKWLRDNFLQEDGTYFKKEGTLALIDLNFFKQINDLHGHVIGDKVLIFIANQLKKLSPHNIRYGGDEFIVIFDKENSLQEYKQILEDFREEILLKKLKAHDTTFKVSFSFGLTHFTPNEQLNTIIERADRNMYSDKIAIKKRVKSI